MFSAPKKFARLLLSKNHPPKLKKETKVIRIKQSDPSLILPLKNKGNKNLSIEIELIKYNANNTNGLKEAPVKMISPKYPIGKTANIPKEKKSKIRPNGIFLLFKYGYKNSNPPIRAPERERPGKYGKSVKPNTVWKTGRGWIKTYKSLLKNKDEKAARKAVLNKVSILTFFLIITRSSFAKL